MKKSTKKYIHILLTAFLVTGCQQKQDPAAVTSDLLVAPKLKTFAANDYTLGNIRLFLWRDDLNAFQVERASSIGKALDALDEYSKFDMPVEFKDALGYIDRYTDDPEVLKYRMKELPKLKEQYTKTRQDLAKEITKIKGEITALKKEISDLEKLLEQTTDPQEQEKIKKQIAEKQELIKAKEQNITSIEAERKVLLKVITSVTNEIHFLNDNSDMILKRIQDYKDKQIELDATSIKLTDELKVVTNFFQDVPKKMLFRFDKNNQPQVEIQSWNVPDDQGDSAGTEKTFSSIPDENGWSAIKNVRYDAQGALFEFDVVIWPEPKAFIDSNCLSDSCLSMAQVYYSFKIARGLSEERNGRILFQGDFKRTIQGRTEKGVAKITDINN